jgi:hypothetical protein
MTFAALSLKLYRIWRIFNNKALRKVKITNTQLYQTVFAVCAVNLVILVTWASVSPLTYSREVIRSDVHGNPLESFGLCSSEHSAPFMALIFTYIMLLFLGGMIMCYKVRTADSDYQESNYIIISLVSQFQMYLLGIPLLFVFSEESSEARFLVAFVVVFCNNLLLSLVMFVPKMIALHKNLEHANSMARTSIHNGTTVNEETGYNSGRMESTNLQHQKTSDMMSQASCSTPPVEHDDGSSFLFCGKKSSGRRDSLCENSNPTEGEHPVVTEQVTEGNIDVALS